MGYQGTTTASAIANTVMKRDGNANVAANNFNSGLTVVAAGGATTTLTAASKRIHKLTGTITGQTFVLPAATTLALGWVFEFQNETTGADLVVQNGGLGVISTIPAGGRGIFTATAIASTAGTWGIEYLAPANASWGSVAGLSVVAPLSAGTSSQFRVDSSGNTVIPVTGVMTGNGATAITASTVTQNGVLLGGASNAVASTSVGATGTFLGGNTATAPTFQTLASAGAITQITGSSGGAQTPSSGNFNILGTGSVTTVGTANTETVQLTGLTNHALQIGAGTATLTQLSPNSTSGIPLISQGASADPAYGTAVVAGGGTGATTLTNHGLLLGSGTSAVRALGVASNGQIPIGSGGADPVIANITAGTGATVSNGAGTISIAAPGATRVLLSSQTASNSAAILFAPITAGTYSTYELEYFNAYPSTNGQPLGIQFSTDNGATYINTNYIGATNYVPVTATTWVSSNSTTSARISAGASATTTDCSISGNVRLYNFHNGGLPCVVGECIFFSTNATATATGLVRSVNTANPNVNGFQVLSGSGNIAQGTFNLYGIL